MTGKSHTTAPGEVPGYALKRYLRPKSLPFTFCPGCGCGTVLNVFASAVDGLGINTRDLCLVSGIGCSSWIPSPYFMADTLHTTHGRALTFATGVKVARPGMKVVVISGDGDIAGIGGNHLIHAARRNIGITVIMVNNQIYGMTGGQVAPTTPSGTKTVTTPYGNAERPFDIASLVAEAGATFVARWTTGHVFQLRSSIQKAINHEGFAFIEVMSQCPEYYGRKAGFETPADLLASIKSRGVAKDQWDKLAPGEREGKFTTGTLVQRTDRKEFTACLRETTAAVQAGICAKRREKR